MTRITPDLRIKIMKEKIQKEIFGNMKTVAESGGDLQNNYTPEEICDMLLEKVQLEGNKSVLVLYNIEIVFGLWKRGFKGSLTFFTSSEDKVRFAKKLFENVRIEYIDKEENPLLRLEEMKNWPEKFDIIVSNPPYSKNLHLKFLDRCIDISEENVIFVHPAIQYVDNKRTNILRTNILKKTENSIKEITLFNGNPVFNIGLLIPCSVTSINKKEISGNFIYKDLINGQNLILEKKEINNLSMFGHRKEFISIKNKIKSLECEKLDSILTVVGFKGDQTHKKVLKNRNSYFIEFTHIRGNIDTNSETNILKEDFFTLFSRDKKVENGRNPGYNIFGEFKTEKEAENFLNYGKTNFLRICLALFKTGSALDNQVFQFIPSVDLAQEWTDEKLYAHFNITEEEQAFIKEIIPPYYEA